MSTYCKCIKIARLQCSKFCMYIISNAKMTIFAYESITMNFDRYAKVNQDSQ